MKNASAMDRGSKILCVITAFALALAGVLGAQTLAVDEAYAAQAKLKITLATPSSVQLKKGETHKIRAKVSKGAKVTYKSSKKSVATVSKKGIVTANNLGSATITIKAKKGKKNAVKNVRVKVAKPASRAAIHEGAPSKAQEPAEQPSARNDLIAVGAGGTVATGGTNANDSTDDKAAREVAERAAAEKAREAAEKAAREATEREAAEKAAREAAEREAAERAAAEQAAREAAQREAAEREAAERAAAEKAEREAVEKAAREAAERAAAEEAAKNAKHSFLFVPNGAQDKAFIQDVKGNGTFALPVCTFARDGYEFAGWNTKEDGSGASYAAKASFNLPDTPSLHVFYAQWKVAKRTGEYTENGRVYFYDANGNKATGWQTVNGAKRYYDPADGGARVGAGERKIAKQLLFGSSSEWYLFDANGAMLTGWQTVNGQTKFFRADGTRAQGEVYIAKGELGSAVSGYRYFDSDGVIQLGWRTIGGVDKYFEFNDGVRASGIFAVPHDGGSSTYCFDTNTGARMADVVQGGCYFRPGDGVGLKLASVANGDYQIISALGSQYLDISAGSTADCANVQTWECTHTNAQIFTIQKASGNYYKIVNANSGKAVDVTGGDSRNGVNVHQYVWNGTDAQLWLPVECNGGTVFFNKATKKVLDVASAICANGTNVQSWEFNDTQAQVWRLYKHARYEDKDKFGMTREERETADSIWNSYCQFRASKGVPAVTRSDYCTQLAYNTSKACSQAGHMQHEIAIPQDQRLRYSDILQYATWRKAGPSAIERWEGSEGHHRMMRNDHGTTEAGVGVYFDGAKWWYTIVYNYSGYNQYQGTLW